ncbi:MAG: DUF1294 domain-containing protein [Oscillospiraceae bacterium]|nr:DUF1294 domain-containing protein [Oscillospiraceae bacterium]
MKIILCVLGVNLLSLLVFGLDKALAVGRKRRIPEATLLTLAFLGGSVGAMLGMTVFHHKTDARAHPAFVWGIPGMFLLELAGLVILFGGK